MKKLILILLFVFPLGLISQEEPFWEYIGGPETGFAGKFTFNKNQTIFVTSYNGIFKSDNEGINWEQILKAGKIVSIAINSDNSIYIVKLSNNVYSGIYHEVYYSDDNGLNWIELSDFQGLGKPKYLAVNSSNHLFGVTGSNNTVRIIITKDNGFHWEEVDFDNEPFSDFHFRDIYIDRNDRIIICCDIDNEGIVFVSSDNGDSWQDLSVLPSIALKCKFLSDSVLLACTTSGPFLSSDNGITWEQNDLRHSTKDAMKSNNGEILISTSNGIYYSVDEGKTWQVRSDGLLDSNLYYFGKSEEGKLFVGSYTGIYTSINNGRSWNQSNIGFCSSWLNDICFDSDGNLYASSKNIFKSTNNGISWKAMGYTTINFGSIFCNRFGHVFVDVLEEEKGLYKSTDGGMNWKHIKEGLVTPSGIDAQITDFAEGHDGTMYASVKPGGVYKSTDNGESWFDTGLGENKDCIFVNSYGDIIAGGRGSFHYSTDDGVTWDWINNFNNPLEMMDMVISSKNQCGFAGGDGGFYRTRNNGKNWYKQTNFDWTRNLAIDSLGYFWNGYWRTSDLGDTWIKSDSGIFHKYFSNLGVSPDGYIFLSPYYGGFYRSKEKYVSVEDKNQFNNRFQLTNYPNPINETTTIEYTTEKAGHVRLSIIDIFGNEISVPIDEYQEAGKHSKIVSICVYPPGVYFYRLETGGKVETRQMVVVR